MNDYSKNKVWGSLLGLSIGDALGMPVECWTQERILEKFPGGIRGFVANPEHRFFKNGMQPGMWTDDTQFSITMAKALLASRKFDMDVIAEHHVKGLAESSNGAGKTTKEAIRRIANGVHWSQSGKTSDKTLGWGNAGAMKIAPMAWMMSSSDQEMDAFNSNRAIVQISAMTHYTKMAAFAAIIQCQLVYEALWARPEAYSFANSLEDILDSVVEMSTTRKDDFMDGFDVDHLEDSVDDIVQRLYKVVDVARNPDRYSLGWAIQEFEGGGPYVYRSYPMALFCLAKYGVTTEALYQAASAGGDTDTTASIAGAIVGALHGADYFPQELIDGLWRKDELRDLAYQFAEFHYIDVR